MSQFNPGSASGPQVDSSTKSASKPSQNRPGPGDLFVCDQCPKVFNRRENLSRHQKTHDASPAHRCAKCSKAFTRSDLLRRHEAGHERWDKKDPQHRADNDSAKRRKVAANEAIGSANSSPVAPDGLRGDINAQMGYPQSHRNAVPHGYSNQIPMHADSRYHGNTDPAREAHSGYQTFDIAQPFPYRSPGIPNQGHHDHLHAQQSFVKDQVDHFAQFNVVDNSLMNFDFSSFLVPSGVGPGTNEWFSYDFYSAMRETGNSWDDMQGGLLDPNLMTPSQEYQASPQDPVQNVDHEQTQLEGTRDVDQEPPQQDSSEEEAAENRVITRISSPPNEASEDDKLPFHWNPKSRQILKANPIIIPDDHPLLKTHNPRFDISEQTLLKLRAFLKPPSGREFHQSQKGTFTLPSLPVINVFIRLFFERFSPQMPVLHHPTVDTNADLPPPLIAIMVVLGAIYSNLKHSRRFSIVLLDIVRWHLQIAVECDNSLMRDNMIIYAEALICHTGLWCGNKRCFELAEVVRGALVTYIRRVHFHGSPDPPSDGTAKGMLQSDWKRWIFEESQRRLYWVIYVIDCQFPSILNLPGTISIGEVSNLLCPADDEFWIATSARNWKNLLGPASIPPSRSFSAAVGPFILRPSPTESEAAAPSQPGRPNLNRRDSLPKLDLNSWSAFLVLMTIQNQIFQFSQELVLSRTFTGDDDDVSETEGDNGSGDETRDTVRMLRKLQSIRRGQLSETLYAWSKAYLNPSRSNFHPSARHFHASSLVIHHLSQILLDVPLSDLQNAIGKLGPDGIAQAMTNLTNWARRSPRIAEEVAYNAVRTIVSFAPTKGTHEDDIRNTDTAPYSIITLFLCHVVLWVFSNVCPYEQKFRFLRIVAENEVLRSSAFFAVLRRALALDEESIAARNKGPTAKNDAPNILFKCGAEMLTRLGTWGASLNLALMIHQRAEM